MNNEKMRYVLAVSQIGEEIFLFYKNKSGCGHPVRILSSNDGKNFKALSRKLLAKKFLGIKNKLKIGDDFKVSKLEQQYFLSYKQEINKEQYQLMAALSKDGVVWKKIGQTSTINDCGVVVLADKNSKSYLMFFGKKSIRVASSINLKDWDVKRSIFLRARDGYFDSYVISVDNVFLAKEGIVLTYLAQKKNKQWGIGAVILDKNNYQKVLWRSNVSLWKQPKEWNSDEVRFIGSVFKRGELLSYWEYAGELHFMPISINRLPIRKKEYLKKKVDIPDSKLKLKKAKNNPILEPRPENSWESRETFNPAAVHLDGNVHLLYRALGESGISVLGYASSKDGFKINKRLKKPIYTPSQPFEYSNEKQLGMHYPYMSGNSWSGCEDPRVSIVGDRLYMTYTAFDGCHPPGVALTSIKIEDFLNKRWNWKIPKLISKPGEIQKNWVIFPEKINGKYAVLHSISPEIFIDYFDSLDSKKITIKSYHNNKSDESRWDNILRGVGAPPLKTDYGWLVLYHAMDRRDPNKYKVGAMLLDYKNPEKVLYRSSEPILEPVEKYENEGSKAGVVYVCGAVVKDEKLFVYYGGADRFVCVATAPLKKFLTAIINSSNVIPFQKIAMT